MNSSKFYRLKSSHKIDQVVVRDNLTTKKTNENKIHVGVVGVGRGMGFAQGAKFVGMELVALCDT
jgi:predicted homoserine dehydrogenase-like protein